MSKQTTVRFPEEFLSSLKEQHNLEKPQEVVNFLIAIYITIDVQPNLLAGVQKELEAGCSPDEMQARITTPMKSFEDELADNPENDLQGVLQPVLSPEEMTAILSDSKFEAMEQEITELRAQNGKLLELLEEERQQTQGFADFPISTARYMPDRPMQPVATRLASFQEFDAAIIGAATPEAMDQVIDAIRESTGINSSQQTGLLMRAKGRKELLKPKP